MLPWEGLKIRPYRPWRKLPLFNFRNQIEGGESFDLHISDWLKISKDSREAEVNTSIACAE